MDTNTDMDDTLELGHPVIQQQVHHHGLSAYLHQYFEVANQSGLHEDFYGHSIDQTHDNQWDLLNRFDQGLEESVREGYLGKVLKQTFKEHMLQKRALNELKQILQEAVIAIQDNFSIFLRDFQYFSDFSELPLEETLSMGKFIIKNIRKINQNAIKSRHYEDKIARIKSENSLLNKKNQQIMKYIQQRKLYSQKLKSKITQLKQQNQLITIKLQKQNQLLQNLTNFEQSADLRYRNRSELLNMTRNLAAKMLKHRQECEDQNHEIDLKNIKQLVSRNNSSAKQKQKRISRMKSIES